MANQEMIRISGKRFCNTLHIRRLIALITGNGNNMIINVRNRRMPLRMYHRTDRPVDGRANLTLCQKCLELVPALSIQAEMARNCRACQNREHRPNAMKLLGQSV